MRGNFFRKLDLVAQSPIELPAELRGGDRKLELLAALL